MKEIKIEDLPIKVDKNIEYNKTYIYAFQKGARAFVKKGATKKKGHVLLIPIKDKIYELTSINEDFLKNEDIGEIIEYLKKIGTHGEIIIKVSTRIKKLIYQDSEKIGEEELIEDMKISKSLIALGFHEKDYHFEKISDKIFEYDYDFNIFLIKVYNYALTI